MLFNCAILTNVLYGQSGSAETAANRDAIKIKDSLSLTDPQRQQIFKFSKEFHLQKQSIKQKFSSQDSIGFYVQKIAIVRDSMYRFAMPINKYELFLQKKNNLIVND